MIEKEYYDVEKILDKKRIRGKYRYLIKWKGYPMEQCTWEPISNLENVKSMVDEFESKNEEINENENKKVEKELVKKREINKKREVLKKEEVKKGENIKKEEEKKEGIKTVEKFENMEFIGKKRKNSESSLKSTEDDGDEIKEDINFSEEFIKNKESKEKVLSVHLEEGELFCFN